MGTARWISYQLSQRKAGLGLRERDSGDIGLCSLVGLLGENDAVSAGTFGLIQRTVGLLDEDVDRRQTGGIGLILAPACVIPPGAPEENLQAVVAAAQSGP